MEDIKIKGIVLSSTDYKEKDKLVQIFSLEYGLITAKLAGCLNPNAKLKFAFQPFCFAEFVMAEKNNFLVVTNANLIESFYDLTKDYENFESGYKMLEIVSKTLKKGEVNLPVFVILLKCLGAICFEKINCNLALLKFVLDTYKYLGYGLNLEKCSDCGRKFDSKKYLKLNTPEIVCSLCKNQEVVALENIDFSIIKIVSQTASEKLSTIKIKTESVSKVLKIVLNNFENVFSISLNK